MNDNNKPAQCFHPDDTFEEREQISGLIKRGYPFVRKTRYHLKYLEVNYFITTGTITIDPDLRYKHKGYDALLTLLEERYPRRSFEISLR